LVVLDLPRLVAGARLNLGKSPPHSKVDKNITANAPIKGGFFYLTKKYAAVQLLRSNSLPMKDLHADLNNSK
jgi:hypothetical protein